MYSSLLDFSMFIVFSIVLFNTLSSIFVLYNSRENDVSDVTSLFPVLSKILPLAAFSTDSLVSLVLEVSLYSCPCTI